MCGNGVLEPGEDCDNVHDDRCYAVDSPNQCRLDCRSLPCPKGYGCGVEGVCRLPSGQFTRSDLALGLEEQTIVAGDFDGDHRKDLLIGAVDSSTVVNFDALRAFQTTKVSLPNGELSVGDFDQDGRDDVCTWSWYEPIVQIYQSRQPDGFAPVANLVEAPDGANTQAADYRWISPEKGSVAVPPLLLVGRTLYEVDSFGSSFLRRIFDLDLNAHDVTGHIGVGEMDESADANCVQFALAARGGDSVELRSTCSAKGFGSVHLPGYSSFAAPTVFLGNIDTDTHLDLIVEDQTSTYVGYGVGDGTFHSDRMTLPVRGGDQSMSLLLQEGTLLDVGDLDGDALSDLVASWSTAFSKPTSEAFACGIRYCKELNVFEHSGAKIVEMTRDGLPDIVAAYGNPPDVGLEFLLGVGDGNFHGFPIYTEGIPALLREETVPFLVGDFDGDLTNDVAFPERRLISGTSPVTATVLYGQALAPPNEQHGLGSLGELHDFAVAELSAPNDGRTDLVTLSDVTRNRAVGLFEGSPSRLMHSPIRFNSNTTISYATACTAGHFEINQRTDAAVTSEAYSKTDSSQPKSLLHFIPGTTGTTARARAATEQLDTDYAIATATLTSTNGRDELLLLSGSLYGDWPEDKTLSLQQFAFENGHWSRLASARIAVSPDSKGEVLGASLRTNDLNGDGQPDAIVLESRANRVLMHLFLSGSDGPLIAQAPVTLEVPRSNEASSSYALSETAWLNLDSDPTPELAVLEPKVDEQGNTSWCLVFHDLDLDARRLSLVSEENCSTTEHNPELVEGDFDGDGIGDLATLSSSTTLFWGEPVRR